MLFCVNANGRYLPTFTLYKGRNLWTSWTVGGKPDSLYGVSPSGWMQDINFETWFCERFVPQTRPPPGEQRLLIFDGHNSHISYKIAKTAFDNNISLLCLPPHTSHGLQPLDVACFKPAKAIWNHVCLRYFQTNFGQNLTKNDFPSLRNVVEDHLIDNPQFAVGGFVECGIWPINRHKADHLIVGNHTNPSVITNCDRDIDEIFRNKIIECFSGVAK